MDRREFLKYVASTAGVAGLSMLSNRVWAVPSVYGSTPKLLVVLLRGAYDGNNLLVPHASSAYYAARPNIAIPKPNLKDEKACLDIGQGYGLPPVLKDNLFAMYKAKQVAFIPFAGTPETSRSHFEAQDLMEMGQKNQSHRHLNYSSGFLNRLVELLTSNKIQTGGISFTSNLPLMFKGNIAIPNISVKGNVRDMANDHRSDLVRKMYSDTDKISTMVQTEFTLRKEVSAELSKEMAESGKGAAPAQGFAKEAQAMAALMRDNPLYSIGFVDVGGWDTHTNQGSSTGTLSTNLDRLSSGLKLFSETIGASLWQQTVVVVMSEFGRTFKENGNRGTDHGFGNTMWVLSCGISGGKVAGQLQAITEKTLNQGRDMPILNDYRFVLGHLLQKMYGLTQTQLEYVFPEIQLQNYGL